MPTSPWLGSLVWDSTPPTWWLKRSRSSLKTTMMSSTPGSRPLAALSQSRWTMVRYQLVFEDTHAILKEMLMFTHLSIFRRAHWPWNQSHSSPERRSDRVRRGEEGEGSGQETLSVHRIPNHSLRKWDSFSLVAFCWGLNCIIININCDKYDSSNII